MLVLGHSRALDATARGWANGCLVMLDAVFGRPLVPAAGQILRQASWSGAERRFRLVDSTPCRFDARDVADRMSSTASRSFWDTPQGTGTPCIVVGGGRARMALIGQRRGGALAQLRPAAAARRMANQQHRDGHRQGTPPVIMECRPIKSCFRDARRVKRTSASRNARNAHCTLGDARSLQHHKFKPAFRMEGRKRHRGEVDRSTRRERDALFPRCTKQGQAGGPCLKFTAAATQVALRRTERVGFFARST